MDYPNIKNHLITYSEAADQNRYVSAEGACMLDASGKAHINMNDISFVLGYSHPRFTETLEQLLHTRMMGHFGILSSEKERLISRFMDVTHGDFDKIFFAASGGEVVDWSIKAARRCTGRDGIISFQNALHGRSFAGAWLSGTPARKEGFGSGLQNVTFWEYPEDGRAYEPAAADGSDIAAVIIEPYQALSGMASPGKEYWQWLRNYTKENGILLIFDEIQTGFGKTGDFFAYEHTGIVPDILLAGKGMSNGFGLGAMLMSQQVGSCIRPWEMSGGSADNDFMCAVANAVFDIFEEEGILEHVQAAGTCLRGSLETILADCGIPGQFRGRGLFCSLELPEGMAAAVTAAAKAEGVQLGRTGNRLMFRPPLVITEAQIQQVCSVIKAALAAAQK